MNVSVIPYSSIRFVKELYPRLKPHDDVIERYRDAIDKLPPATVARDNILVDGWHGTQARVREGITDIPVVNLGNLSDAEIIRESIKRNASHGQQLTSQDKKRMAVQLWTAFAHLTSADRLGDISELLAVSRDAVERWTKDVRAAEKQAQKDLAWDMWLDCCSQTEIAERIGVTQQAVSSWLQEIRKCAEFVEPPGATDKTPWGNIQHFDIWQFATSGKDAGQQSYFGAVPPQVMQNLLWFYTEPGDTVVDLFAGSGTTIDVCKEMGRRVWASDIRGNHYSPHMPIHRHDATQGWPEDAPQKVDLVFLDPPYWKQASGRYSSEPNELAEMDISAFSNAWSSVTSAVTPRARRIAYIISPTQDDDGSVVDHATQMLAPFMTTGWRVERRIIVPYSTQQATGQQVTWARENKRMLKLYRDLVVLAL